MKINIQNLNFKTSKMVKDMLPGEIGVFLKNSHNIDDESDPIVLYRTTNDAEFDIINLSGLDSGFMFFDNPDAFVGMLENKDVVIDITEKKKDFDFYPKLKTVKRSTSTQDDSSSVDGTIKIKMKDFYDFVEMTNPMCCDKVKYSEPIFNKEKNIIQVDFSIY